MKNFNILGRTSSSLALFAALIVGAGGCARAQDVAKAQNAPAAINDVKVQTEPLLHPLFSDNAVLQRDRAVPIWGWAQPQTKITVRLDNGAAQAATAGADGRWTVSLKAHVAGGPHTLSVMTDGQTEARKNLLFGDVWVCSGQSNMAYDLRSVNNYQAEVAAANYPEIRLMQVPTEVKAAPIQTFQGAWQVCSPQTVEKFSATGYFFGRALYKDLKVPIGLIDSSVSGTPAQSWVSAPALRALPNYTAQVDAITDSAKLGGTYAEQSQAWWQTNDPGTKAGQQAADFNDGEWKTISQPGLWEEKGFGGFDGVMWLRRAIDVPANWAGRDLTINLGNVDDQDTTFWNGAQIGASDDFSKERNYKIPGALVKAGRNVIAIRVLDTGGGGGLVGPALSLKSGDQTLSLAGDWKVRQGPELKGLPARPLNVSNTNDPTVLYNSKIAPLLPATVKGILWYQGESDADDLNEARQYRTLLPALVNDWHAKFGEQTPFYIMQLANFKAQDDAPNDAPWPRLREAQSMTARELPNTYLTVITDLGDEKNVHFPDKQAAGARMALSALEHTYGQKIEGDGPALKGVKADGATMQLTFDNAQALNLKGDANRVFALAGRDLKFFWAKPVVAGNLVTLSSPDVAAPVYARYAWSSNPRANLFNSAGLPASPFRTDGDARFPIALAQDKANALFDAWNAAFLMREGGQTYYTRETNNRPSPVEDSWVASLNVQLAQDAYENDHSAAHRQLVADLMDTFIKQYDYDWSTNDWNDDIGWLGITFVRGYQITGDKRYLDKAVYAFNLAYDRGWDTVYGGGGIWEHMGYTGRPGRARLDGKPDKLSLSNSPFVIIGVPLYQITGDAAYLTKAKAMFQWLRENSFNRETGEVHHGVRWTWGEPDKPELEDSSNVYDYGAFVEAANKLYRVTGDKMYRDDAELAIDYIVNKYPVLNHNGGGQNQWAYWFVKGLGEFATQNDAWPKYRAWMQANADAVWKNRNDMNLVGNNWLKVNTDPKQSALESTSAVAVWQALPPSDPTALAGNYTLRSVASKLALAVAADAATPGAAVVQQADPPGASAVWTLVPTLGGYYQIKNAKSGLVMAVADASVQSGAKIVQRAAQGFNPGADQWMPVKNLDGSYSFINRNSKQALDDPALADEPGTQYGQWFANSSYAQQFNLIPQK